jgi:tetratricopeptide (TPR) repeat protein
MERGRRLWARARTGTQQQQVEALREFERAYQRDPRYADAFGFAAFVLERMALGGAPRALHDSAAVLAHRALALDPGQVQAVNALGAVELVQGRGDEGRRLTERAARSFPSSAALQSNLATIRYQAGDSAGALDALARALALAPRSLDVIVAGAYTMLALRRYDDARDLVARAQALEPETPVVQTVTVSLAFAVGDTAALSAAARTLRVGGAGRGAAFLFLMRYGDAAMQQELVGLSLASLGAATALDSLTYYSQKAQLFLTRGEAARARALADSAHGLAALQAATVPAGSPDAAGWWREVAWYAATRGDRQAAVAALERGAADPLIAGRTGGLWDASQTCYSAEVYGLLGDAEAMLPLLRRCLTMSNGYSLAQFAEPGFAPVRADPRVRALVAELTAAQARARSTPVRTGG